MTAKELRQKAREVIAAALDQNPTEAAKLALQVLSLPDFGDDSQPTAIAPGRTGISGGVIPFSS